MPKVKKNKRKKKLTAAQKLARAERRAKYQYVFLNGRRVRVERAPTIDGMPVNEFIAKNADPIWLLEAGFYELLPVDESPPEPESRTKPCSAPESRPPDDYDGYEIPF